MVLLGQAATFAVTPAMDVSAVVTTVGVAGAAILGSSFAVGAGFRLAKKGYSWIMGKM